jgi:DNA polymerase III sliding clamp (beta) subunit (PCNA family)
MMVGLIKTQAGSLVAALALCALPLGERQTQRIPALGAVRLAGGGDGLSITTTSFDGTITTSLLEAEADGEVAVRLERLADLARHFPAHAEIAIAADDRAVTVTSGRSSFRLPVFSTAELMEPRVLREETGRVDLDAKIARDLFARPTFAAADEASRPYLRGIFLRNTVTILSRSPPMDSGSAASQRRSPRHSRRIAR